MKILRKENLSSGRIHIYLFGVKIISYNGKKPRSFSIFHTPVFRNDDVSYDTNMSDFRRFCEIFHKYGYSQLHAVTLYGLLNCRYVTNGIPVPYKGYQGMSTLNYETIKKLSEKYFIGDNKDLIKYLNSIPDKIALHGLYHTDYSKMSYDEQYRDIKLGLEILKKLFPQKRVRDFVAPYNRTNADTFKVCKKFGLRVSAQEGDHLEDMISSHRKQIKRGMVYRYHHHRFYPDSTFSYYDLSFDKLDHFFNNTHELPNPKVFAQIIEKHHTQPWFTYAYTNFKERAHAYLSFKWIKHNIKKNKRILETGCGAGGILYHLFHSGYKNLYGYDYDTNAIAAAKEIAETVAAPISFSVTDGHAPQLPEKYDVIIGLNWIYHVPNYGLESFIQAHLPYLNNNGIFVFDVIDATYNDMENNQYSTQDINKPVNQRRPSEYLYRYSQTEVFDLAKKYNLSILKIIDTKFVIPHKIYILKANPKTRICLLCDKPNWAFDISAKKIKKLLSNDFDIDIKYVVEKPKLKPKEYDLLHVFFWGEDYHKKFKFPKHKVLKEISSWRWSDNPLYGPCTPQEMVKKYTTDAKYIFCTSVALYDVFKKVRKNVFYCGKGFDPEIFSYKKQRKGDMSICWAGNIKDPVKGVEEILIPSTKNKYTLNLASDLSHSQMCDFYNSNDIYVVCSRNEASPLTLMESMACGCFPVVNEVGIVPEIIRHKENGYIVKGRTVAAYREAFKWCKENIEYIRKQQKNIAEYIYNKRRWELMVQNYKKMYKECTNNK